eukprot:760806-Hanusia_phi.AAC.1
MAQTNKTPALTGFACRIVRWHPTSVQLTHDVQQKRSSDQRNTGEEKTEQEAEGAVTVSRISLRMLSLPPSPASRQPRATLPLEHRKTCDRQQKRNRRRRHQTDSEDLDRAGRQPQCLLMPVRRARPPAGASQGRGSRRGSARWRPEQREGIWSSLGSLAAGWWLRQSACPDSSR